MSKVLPVTLGVIALTIGLWVGVSVWSECRDAGHSVLYCLKLVSR